MAQMNPTPLPFEPGVQVTSTPEQSSFLSFIVRIPVAFVLSGIVVVLSGLVWGVLAYLTSSIYVMVAILIGIAVSFAITIPFKRVPLLLALVLIFPAIVLTIIAVLWGDYVFYVLTVMNERGMDVLKAMMWVADYFIPVAITEEGESISSIIFGLIGAVLGFFNAFRR